MFALITAAIVGGTVADGLPEVVAIRSGDHVVCTGTLIAPRVVVTAAHCIAAGAALDVGFARIADLRDARWVAVGLAVRHPRFDPATHADDVGVLVLAEAAPAWVTPRERGGADVSGPVTAIGFGHADPAGQDPHVRRLGTVDVIAVDAGGLDLIPAPAAPCHGDSGGAVVADTPAGPRLIGVIVAGDALCAASARAVRIDAHASLIAPIEAAAAGAVATGAWCIDDASCAGGACWFPPDAPGRGYCAGACAGDGDCAAGMACEGGACRWPRPSPGAFGGACAATVACDGDRECLASADDPQPRCTQRCFEDGLACPDAAACVPAAAPASSVCATTARGGCATGGGGGRGLAGLAAVAALAIRRRRARV